MRSRNLFLLLVLAVVCVAGGAVALNLRNAEALSGKDGRVINLAVGFPGFFEGGPSPGFLTGVAASESGAIYVTGDLENVIYKITTK